MLLPDTVALVGTPTRAFQWAFHSWRVWAGGFAAATGVMPLDMPESVLVSFKG